MYQESHWPGTQRHLSPLGSRPARSTRGWVRGWLTSHVGLRARPVLGAGPRLLALATAGSLGAPCGDPRRLYPESGPSPYAGEHQEKPNLSLVLIQPADPHMPACLRLGMLCGHRRCSWPRKSWLRSAWRCGLWTGHTDGPGHGSHLTGLYHQV